MRRKRGRLAEPGQLFAGRFEIESLIAAGGMADVYRATDRRLARDVAIKVVDPVVGTIDRVADRFFREARAMAAIDSLHVVPIYDVGIDGRRLFLVEKLLHGDGLDRLMRAGSLSVAELVRIASDVLRGLEAVHAAGMVHRDIKPSNVFLTRDGVGVLLDLGIVLVARESHLTDRGVVLGTPEFMSPEQALGDEPGPTSDLYALGLLVLYAMVGRRDAVDGDTSVRRRVCGDAWLEPQLDQVPGPLRACLRRALARRIEDRFANAAEMRRMLEQVGDGDASGAVAVDAQSHSLPTRQTMTQ